MDLKLLHLGVSIAVQYNVLISNSRGNLQWYEGIITGLSLSDNSETSITVKFNETSEFEVCTETFTMKSDQYLSQGRKRFPYKLVQESGPTTPNTSDCAQDLLTETKEVKSGNLHSIHKRLELIEDILSVSSNRLYINLCGVMNSSLRKYMNRVKKPSSTSPELVQSCWSTSMDCSFLEYKAFYEFLDVKLLERCSVQEFTTEDVHRGSAIQFKSTKDFSKFFGIRDSVYNKLLIVSRSDRQGRSLAFKALETYSSTDSAVHPRVFCLGGRTTVWSEESYFYYREHGHRTQAGVFSAPFTRINSYERYQEVLQLMDEPTTSPISIKWKPTTTPSICTVGVSERLLMGKIEVELPYVEFNDMTVAAKVVACHPQGTNRNLSDASSSSS